MSSDEQINDKDMNEKDLELISSSLDLQLSEFERRRLNNILTNKASKIDKSYSDKYEIASLNNEAVKKLQRYSLISAILKKECGQSIDVNFSQRVIQAIEKQLAGEEFDDTDMITPSFDSHLSEEGNNRSQISYAQRPYGMKQIAGLAIAVSVATLSFLSFQQYAQTGSDSEQYISSTHTHSLDLHANNAVEKVNKISPRVQFAPVQLNAQPPRNTIHDAQSHALDHEIEAYIYNHSGYASGRIVSPYSEITKLQDHSE